MNKGKTILIIENDFNLRETLCEALEFEGYKTVSAGNREQALKILSSSELPSFIFLDIPKGISDPKLFAEEFMRDLTIGTIPIIVASDRFYSNEIKNGLSFIKMPFDLNLILTVLQKQCGLAETV